MHAQHISTEDARTQGIAGSDVFRYTHLLYKDDVHRDYGVVRLNIEAIKAFSDTVTVMRRHELAAEHAAIGKWFEEGGMAAGTPFPRDEATTARSEYRNDENLKIAAGFELHLKARLLAGDYVVHKIDKRTTGCSTIARDQRERPVKKTELMAVQQFRFDGKENYLPGLDDASLEFKLLVSEAAYRAALGLTDQQLAIIEDYRRLRNQIHFPGDRVGIPGIGAYGRPIAEFLVEFINTEVIACANALIRRHDFNYKPLVLLA